MIVCMHELNAGVRVPCGGCIVCVCVCVCVYVCVCVCACVCVCDSLVGWLLTMLCSRARFALLLARVCGAESSPDC